MRMFPAPKLQNIFSNLLKPVLCSLMIVLLGAGFVVAEEIDDSSLFVQAFSAYQKMDYLLAIEKIGAINQLFPDTPLRDVTLLLLARSAYKSGDNELAAITISRFNSEFASNPLKPTIEEELLRLGSRWQNGEGLSPAIPLRTAALKVRRELLALEERSTAEKNEQAPLLKEMAAQEDVRASINISGSMQTVAVGQRGEIPFEMVNLGTSDESFALETSAPSDYEAMLNLAGQSNEKLARVTIAPAAPFKGSIMFRMPPDKVDRHNATISLRAVSEKYPHVVQIRDTRIITAAPLVRVVAKPEKQRLAPGEQTRYRVTVLNVGTLPALALTVSVIFPPQIELQGGEGSPHLRETAGGITFGVDTLETGKLAEFTMDVKVRKDSLNGQELRSQIEVAHGKLQIKEHFTSAAALVQAEEPFPH